MRKNIYLSITGLCALLLTVSFTSCKKDFLDEQLITQESTQSFTTEAGLDKLAIGMYQNLEFHFAYEWAYTIHQYGADEFSVGNDAQLAHYNNYTSNFNSASSNGVADLWNNMYGGISSANIMIQNVPLYYNQSSANYNTRLGEGYFLRGFNYFRLVQQYGGVPLVTAPVPGASTDFTRNTAEEVYAQVIADLKEAYNLLPSTPSETGRFTKWAAAHFIAKACLFRASELNDSWNSSYKTQDLADVIQYANEVIAHHPLCNDYVDLWNYTTPDGPNESVSEIVLATQFSDDATTYGRYGNQIHLYYPAIYQNMAGMRRDIAGDREFSRMRPTDYGIEVFDLVNDSRFWKSYITTYACNNPNAAPTWGAYAPEGKSASDKKFKGGELAIKYIVNKAGDNRYTADGINYEAPHTFVRYFAGESRSYLNIHGNAAQYGSNRSRFIALSKFRDGSRIAVANQFGQRDGILARSAEDYLMVAEAYGRQGNYSAALPFINALRQRAGYAEGEDRAKHVDGGQAYKNNPNITVPGDGGSGLNNGFASFCEYNTYYESNNMAPTTASTKNAMTLGSTNDIFNSTNDFYDVLGASSEADKFMVFIMNERTRELCGELLRWPDLARTKQLEKRWSTFNDGSIQEGAYFDPDKNYLRPIPQTFLDAITADGVALTSEQKSAIQNPGW